MSDEQEWARLSHEEKDLQMKLYNKIKKKKKNHVEDKIPSPLKDVARKVVFHFK